MEKHVKNKGKIKILHLYIPNRKHVYTHNIISLLVYFFLTFNLCIFPLYILFL